MTQNEEPGPARDEQYDIRVPVVTRRLSDGTEVVATPVWMFERDELRQFATARTKNWSLAKARRLTPGLFTPASMADKADGFRYDDLASDIHREIAPPKFWDEVARRTIPLDDRFQRVRKRWWRRRVATNHGLDLAAELKAARSAHWRLRRAFGGWVRRGVRFDAERREQQREGEGNPIGFSVRTEWQCLARAILRLVDFDRRYLWTRFGLFAMRFADCTPYAEGFFEQLAGPLRSKGSWSRIDHLNGERWELCLRAWNAYWDNMGVRPYRKMRSLILKVILNYEFLKTGRHTVAPDSVRRWLTRNGW